MAESVTPMMRQYRRIKSELSPDIILFFRLGDFYEMFFEDAQKAAPLLDVALTKRNKVPMCGVPHHALETYLAKLIKAGQKVAVCDQVEDASASKGIVRREVTRVITAGTVTESNILESDQHNFLAGICRAGDMFGFVLLDLSTGLFQGEEMATPEAVRDSLKRFVPTECLVPSAMADDPVLKAIFDSPSSVPVSACEDWTFEYESAYDNMIRHFGVHSLEGFGCEKKTALVGAAGGVLYYIREELKRQVGHIHSFHVMNSSDFLLLDES
ncbi:DNA mismatch repair protein MutS, partial [Verrucomicrobiota bacterium]